MSLLTAAQQKALTAAFASVPQHSSSIRLNTASPTQNSDYPKPQVQEAVSDILDPLLGRLGVHIDIAYPSMNASDIIGLSFNGNDTFTPVNGSLFGKVTFAVPVADVGLAVGKTIQVIYAVVRPDGVILSETLALVVQPIAQDKLPTPQVTEASQQGLDLNAFAGDAHVTVAPWPLIAVGQTVWLTVTGPGGVPTIKLLEGHTIGAEEVRVGLNIAVARAALEKFTNGDTLNIVCKVEFEGRIDEQKALTFPGTDLAIILTPAVVVEDFESFPIGLIAIGTTLESPNLTITPLTGQVLINHINEFAPYLTGKVLDLLYNASALITLKHTATDIKYGLAIYAENTTLDVSYFNESNQLINHFTLTQKNGEWHEYHSPRGKIKFIKVESKSHFTMHVFIDNLSTHNTE